MSILDLRLLESRIEYPNGLDAQNLREQQYGWINAAKRSNLLSMAAMSDIKNSWGRSAVRIAVMSHNKPTVTSGSMDCAFGDSTAVGTYVDVTFIQGWVPVSMVPRQAEASELTPEQIFSRQWRDAELAIADEIEAAIAGVVDTAIATTYNSGLVGATSDYPLAANALQVSAALKPRFFNDVKSIVFADDFDFSMLEVIGDANLPADVAFYGAQGGANNTNTQFQFNGFNFGYSRSTVTTAAARSTGYVMQPNSIAYTSRVSGDARANRKSTDGTSWMTYNSELLGLELEVMYKSGCADVAAITPNPDDTGGLKEQWKLYYNIAILKPYETGTNGGIKKFDILP